MKNKLLLFSLLILTLIGCNNRHSDTQDVASGDGSTSNLDTIVTSHNLEREKEVEEYADSMIKELRKKPYLDSTGMYQSPVQVVSAKFIKEEYSSYKSIKLTYKNVSEKNIQAIRFEWYGENAFGEPADMGSSLIEGSGGGFTEETLRPGGTGSGIWSILSRDGKKIIMARAYEVVFDDGSKWKLRQ